MFAEWYYATNGQRHGPIPESQLKELAANGGLLPSDLVWQEGTPNWVPAKTVPGLFASSPTAMQTTPAGSSLLPPSVTGDREVHEYRDPIGMQDYQPRRRRQQNSSNGVPFVLILGGVIAVSVIGGIVFAVASNGNLSLPKSSGKSSSSSSTSWSGSQSYTVRLEGDPKGVKHEGFHTKGIHLRSGDTITIKVRSDLNSDVDLYLVGPGRKTVARDISTSEHCYLQKRISRTGTYTITLDNLGPGNNICRVTYKIERKG